MGSFAVRHQVISLIAEARTVRTSYIWIVVVMLLVAGCGDEPTNVQPDPKQDTDYLLFGHYYGMCAGETCIETYKLTNSQLFEDSVDHYPDDLKGYPGKYVVLPDSLFQKIKGLENELPPELLTSESRVFGMPDVADGGGMYVERSENGVVKVWLIDNNRRAIPAYLQTFVERMRESIDLLSDP